MHQTRNYFLLPYRLPGPGFMKVLFSLVVDDSPVFVYQGYHLVQSILRHCGGEGTAVCVNVTPGVAEATRAVFRELGCRVAGIERCERNPCCNKIAQFPNLASEEFDLAVLLDTDTILTGDIRPWLRVAGIQAKIVDMPSPSLAALEGVARLAGMKPLPPVVRTDSGTGETFAGNCNGGFYAIPRNLFSTVAKEWPKWLAWLFKHIEPLRAEGKERHVDQVAMWLAIKMNGLPCVHAPSNLNYYVHFNGDHLYYEPTVPVCVVHYHNKLDAMGLIAGDGGENKVQQEAVRKANVQIEGNIHAGIFEDFRRQRQQGRGGA